MSARNVAATMLGSDTIGVFVLTEVAENGARYVDATYQASPLDGAPTITPVELAAILRTAADQLDPIEAGE